MTTFATFDPLWVGPGKPGESQKVTKVTILVLYC